MNEKLFALLAKNITGSTTVKYGETELDFSKMQRLSMREAIVKYWPPEAGVPPTLDELAASGGAPEATKRYNVWAKQSGAAYAAAKGSLTDGEWTGLLFETMAEDKLIQPTILYDFPTDISPLRNRSRRSRRLPSDLKSTLPGWKWRTGFGVERSSRARAPVSGANCAGRG